MDFLLKDQHRTQLAAEWKNLFDARQNNLFSSEIGLMILVFLKNMWKSAYKTDTNSQSFDGVSGFKGIHTEKLYISTAGYCTGKRGFQLFKANLHGEHLFSGS